MKIIVLPGPATSQREVYRRAKTICVYLCVYILDNTDFKYNNLFVCLWTIFASRRDYMIYFMTTLLRVLFLMSDYM